MEKNNKLNNNYISCNFLIPSPIFGIIIFQRLDRFLPNHLLIHYSDIHFISSFQVIPMEYQILTML